MTVLVVRASELALNTLLKDYRGAGVCFEHRGAFVNDGLLLTRHKGAEQVSVTYKRVFRTLFEHFICVGDKKRRQKYISKGAGFHHETDGTEGICQRIALLFYFIVCGLAFFSVEEGACERRLCTSVDVMVVSETAFLSGITGENVLLRSCGHG
ncbi:hypothetical protein TcYC6_0103720 [Trypanosoma cruzi]|nr:hypothetical protein TcYC6_0103720 [Trypanosoma cruzi]RNC46737.1 hypothetical protein TcCL_NonESM03480 [Trypanosoma cruzi]